jgi:hypothetical protein
MKREGVNCGIVGSGRLYKDLDIEERTAADTSARTSGACGLGGREPVKNGWANLARALAARWEYLFWACCTGAGGGGGGGAGEELPPRVGNRGMSDMLRAVSSVVKTESLLRPSLKQTGASWSLMKAGDKLSEVA